MEQVTGGDLVAECLERVGVEVVFGIPSVHNLPIYDSLRRRGRIRAITVRHEQGAAGAADGYARVTGRLGVCITSTGPGAANAMGALLEARTSSTPVLHITGQIDSRMFGKGRGFIHEVPDQAAMLASVSKWSSMVRETGEIVPLLGRAVTEALTHRQGPVSLEIPIDLQYAACDAALAERLDPELVGRALADLPTLDEAALDAAAEAVASSERILIWAGGGVIASGAAEELTALAHLLGAGVITSPNGRGSISERDTLCIGNLPWDEGVRGLCSQAGLLIAVGTRFQGPNTQNWQMPLPERIVHIDVDPGVIGRNYPAEVAVVGDARQALKALSDRVAGRLPSTAPAGASGPLAESGGGRAGTTWAGKVRETARTARAALRSTLGPQEGLLDELEAVLPAGTVVVKDSTIPAYTWGNRLLTVDRPRTAIMPNGFAIGLGVPQALGAAAAGAGRQVVLMVGDGGFMLAPGELATYAEERLGVVVLLFNDGGYGILRNIQDKQYAGRIGVELGRPDFVALAGSMGVVAERVDSVAAYRKAVEAALGRAESGAPQLIEIDLDAIGPMASPFIGTSRPPAPR